jgi:hypothetical protein
MQAPPVITTARPRLPWLIVSGVLLTAAAGCALLFRFDPSQYHFYPRCILYTTTGILCPGCGSQRALYQLLHGHVTAALRCNALLILGLPVAAFLCTRFAARWLSTGGTPSIDIPVRWIKLLAIGVTIFAMLRNIPCAPFTYLAPP